MLFSEPKIPQSFRYTGTTLKLLPFQCSSASRKFLNGCGIAVTGATHTRFSALQRAENSSIDRVPEIINCGQPFQCSSASRKFLNIYEPPTPTARGWFQCSSASRKFLNCNKHSRLLTRTRRFSALQRAENSSMEDKYPRIRCSRCFSALQRAENSSIDAPASVR